MSRPVNRTALRAEENRPAYDRVRLSAVFDGLSAADLDLGGVPSGVALRLSTVVVAIDRSSRTVTCSDGSVLEYDALVLATGSRPFVPRTR